MQSQPRQELIQQTSLRSARPSRREPGTTAVFWAFVGPLMLGLTVFTLVPLVWGVLLSLNDARGSVKLNHWVGLQKYLQLLHDPAFLSSLQMVVLFTVLFVPTVFCISLGLAMLVGSVKRGRAVFLAAIFLPTACSYVAASLIWRLGLFNGLNFSIANRVIGLFHIEPLPWTFSVPWVWLVLVSLRLWLQIGFNMLLFLAGLQEIPRQLYEAAQIDGADGGWATFRYITFPMLRNTSIFILFTNIVAGFQAFDEFYNVLGPTSSAAGAIGARPPLWYLYDLAFQSQDYGLASAGALIVALLIMLATVLQVRLFGLGQSDG